MKVTFPIIILLILITGCDIIPDPDGSVKLINGNWEYTVVDSVERKNNRMLNSFFENPSMRKKVKSVTLPHAAYQETDVIKKQHQGNFVYRKIFTLGPDSRGKKLYVRFDASLSIADIYINDQLIYKKGDGYLHYKVDRKSVV